MKLSKKTFMYSSIISVVIVVCILGYFILMLPSLYVDYMERLNYETIKNVQESYLKTGDFNLENSKGASYIIGIVIPEDKNEIKIQNYLGGVDIKINDDELKKILDDFKATIKNAKDDKNLDSDGDTMDFEQILDMIKRITNKDNSSVSIEFFKNDTSGSYEKVSSEMHIVSDNICIFENNVKDDFNYYTTYNAFSEKDNKYIISTLPVMTPQMSEIRGIVFESLPVIVLLVLCIVILGTMKFSRKIVEPITMLSKHAVYIKDNKKLDIQPFILEGEDEISDLSRSLNDMYVELNKNYNELMKKNKRQMMFLRASSHQLKTPISASLLLIDGMINEIGKFKNTKEYLPVLKKQLLSMKKLVDEILSINSSDIDIKRSKINMNEMIKSIISDHSFEITDKKIKVELQSLEEVKVVTIGKLLYKIIDNLFNNAIKFSYEDSVIKIKLCKESIEIINYGENIDHNILPHIFEPFVTGNSKSGHGFGLYIVSYYCDILGYDIEISNIDNGVKCILKFSNNI